MKWKKLEAVMVQLPQADDEVKDALTRHWSRGDHGIGRCAATRPRQRGHTETYRGHEYKIDLLPKVKLEMIVPARPHH